MIGIGVFEHGFLIFFCFLFWVSELGEVRWLASWLP